MTNREDNSFFLSNCFKKKVIHGKKEKEKK